MVESPLLVNLVFAMGAALIGAVLAVRLGQSVVLGYILAGVVIGPFTPGPVGDVATVEALAEIGIIFLMFAIGVQLSFRDLLAVGRTATFGGLAQVLCIIALGYVVGIALGWRPLEALFFGAVASNSSSTILSKVLGERGELDTEQGRIGLAWSSVQDMSTIALVVILSALAGGGEGLLTDLLWALGKSALFLALIVPLGIIVLPRLFERVAALGNREIFILTVGAVALGTAYASSFFGLSLALGAFVAGIVVGESDLSHQILGEVMPLRDIFAGLFFVSVGMLVDPVFVANNLGLLLLTLALIVAAKGLLSAGIVGLAGYPLRTALLTGVGLAQSAEFSFLLARVGADVGAVSPDVFSLMLAGAAASIVLSPLLHQAMHAVTRWLDGRLPLSPLASQPHLEGPEKRPRGHAVICGYGRVGRVIAGILRQRGLRFVAIDHDQRLVRQLRDEGVPALLGNTAHPLLLEHANVAQARVLVVAIPDPLVARQTVDHALRANPRLDIVVRTHSDTERDYMHRRGVSEAVIGEQELALEMARHTLHRFGVAALEIQAIIQSLRRRT